MKLVSHPEPRRGTAEHDLWLPTASYFYMEEPDTDQRHVTDELGDAATQAAEAVKAELAKTENDRRILGRKRRFPESLTAEERAAIPGCRKRWEVSQLRLAPLCTWKRYTWRRAGSPSEAPCALCYWCKRHRPDIYGGGYYEDPEE
jgi:hypothetical protein